MPAISRSTVQSTKPTRLAVVGGGPKAIAIAAKAWALKELSLQDVEVAIFESDAIGAAWNGRYGYSDGEQRLCTLAERDLGFPYKPMYGPRVDEAMLRFSWQQFLLTRDPRYCDWLDAGRKPPKHREYAEYLQWAGKRSNARVVHGRVEGLRATDGQWEVAFADSGGGIAVHHDYFDGVVFTGTGPAKTMKTVDETGQATTSPHIFNGRDFWSRQKELRKLIARLDRPGKGPAYDTAVVIIGGGGTAAASLAWLLSNGCLQQSIHLVASQASLHTRVDSVFENKLFSDDSRWATLSPENQDAFFDRLNRGVVWSSVIDKVAAAENLTLTDGRAQAIVVHQDGSLSVSIKQGNGETIELNPSILVDASGFDPWWFLPLIEALPTIDEKHRKRLADRLGHGLQFARPKWTLPRLHAPMLSKRVGPGFASLMVMGTMSDRILRTYLGSS